MNELTLLNKLVTNMAMPMHELEKIFSALSTPIQLLFFTDFRVTIKPRFARWALPASRCPRYKSNLMKAGLLIFNCLVIG